MSPVGTSRAYNEPDLFNYFRTYVAPEIAGAFDQEYWLGNLLRQAQSEPVVWHTCNAIAAAHKMDRIGICDKASLVGEQKSLSLQPYEQYHAAIQHMKHIVPQPDLSLEQKRNVALVSLLFTIFAFMRGDLEDCNAHTMASWSLVDTWKLWEQTRLYRPRDRHSVHPADSLIYLCVRIETIGNHIRQPSHKYEYGWTGCSLKLRDDPFISVTEAYFEMELICNAATDITVRPGPKSVKFTPSEIAGAEDLRGRYRARLTKWQGKFGSLQPSCGEDDKLALAILELRAAMMRTIVFTEDALAVSELCWDSCTAEFARMIGMAKDILAMRYAATGQNANAPPARKPSHRSRRRTLAIGPMVNETLYLIVRLCRDPVVRRRALALLAHDFHLSPGIDTLLYIHMGDAIRAEEEREWDTKQQQQQQQQQLEGKGIVGSSSPCGCSRRQTRICDGHRVCSSCLDCPTRNSAVLCVKTVECVNRDGAWRRIPLHYGSYNPELTPLFEI
ncbi:hypothetical protein V2A60_010278 [Cordyceps javanica]|uniref:C6 zinc finger domain-containing protein n=1 Tax=Cordyceps javanica TaxID=43265 RepID=A0A545VUF1_9HYPO|nr:C6 zinc finger domain-containing protein [Cordyceps javanica]TQW05351.1 C6 zinc finger domain protein [Cordyceps javanica]